MGSQSIVPGKPEALPQALDGLGRWLAEKPRARTIVLKSAVGTLIEAEAFEEKREVAQTAGHTARAAILNLAVKVAW